MVLIDGLSTDSRQGCPLPEHGKAVVAVLQGDSRAILADAGAPSEVTAAELIEGGSARRQVWPLEALITWPWFGRPVSVLRTFLTSSARRHLERQPHAEPAGWMRLTTLSGHRADSSVALPREHGCR